MLGGRRGQSGIELMLLLAIVVVALVGMAVYLQRGYQGYLYSSASGQGTQFDPRQTYSERQQLTDFTQKVDIEFLPLTSPTVDDVAGDPNLPMPDLPGGPVPGRMLRTSVKAQTSWAVSRRGTYDAQ